LEILQDGFGFLRSADSSYLAGPDDIYVSRARCVDSTCAPATASPARIRPPKDSERYFALLKVDEINFSEPNTKKHKILFENLTPLFPNRRLTLERGNGSTEDLSMRIVDLIAPIGRGQRGLIVSPPKAGKTILLQSMAKAIVANDPEVVLIVLLIDERPEEVTEMQRSVRGEVLPALRRTAVAPRSGRRNGDRESEASGRAQKRRRDSARLRNATRRAYNTIVPSQAKCLTAAWTHTRWSAEAFLRCARNIEEGGSLTIIGTALSKPVPDGRSHLRGVQGYRQHGTASRAENRRETRVFPP
jgi:transcription termination factor Rho